MPMKRSGRSVEDASRVIEIDEVLVAMIASGFSDGAQIGEDLALDVFLLGRRLDHEIAARQASYFSAGLMRAERRLAVVLADRLLADLARHVAVDGRHAGLDAVGSTRR